ncbi:hypothetical protein X777_14304 [Ooceraea biroi]|uniref:Uncharacterized protein n=1 Tax=Ooceraea biroi TaxID=2015173 RepID=A0A026VWL7_OOCBI|nr:hypothetical protein X777_14304 [Ooceraea biroi]
MRIIYDNGSGVRVYGQWEIPQCNVIPKRRIYGGPWYVSIGNSGPLLMAPGSIYAFNGNW